MYEIFDNTADNEKIYRFFNENTNYKVMQASGPADTVCIFFSSNSLFLPSTYSSFHSTIVDRDRYEWENLAKDPELSQIAGEFIFVRDIYKNWWLEGLCGKYNSQAKMLDLLRNLTSGKRVLTVGTSAGGYAAILFGVRLQAERIYAFSSQIDLHIYNRWHPIKHYSKYLDGTQNNAKLDLHFELQEYRGALYYLYPSRCQEDIEQAQYIYMQDCKETEHIRMMPVRRSKHGRTVLPISVLKFLSMSAEQADKIYQHYRHKEINPYEFLFRTSGFLPGVRYLLGRMLKPLMSRIGRKR